MDSQPQLNHSSRALALWLFWNRHSSHVISLWLLFCFEFHVPSGCLLVQPEGTIYCVGCSLSLLPLNRPNYLCGWSRGPEIICNVSHKMIQPPFFPSFLRIIATNLLTSLKRKIARWSNCYWRRGELKNCPSRSSICVCGWLAYSRAASIPLNKYSHWCWFTRIGGVLSLHFNPSGHRIIEYIRIIPLISRSIQLFNCPQPRGISHPRWRGNQLGLTVLKCSFPLFSCSWRS